MTAATQPGPTSITSLLLEGMDLFDSEVRHVKADDWARSTPCAHWTVTELVRHTSDTADRVTAFLRGETWQASASQAHAAERWAEASGGLRAAIAHTSLDDRWPIPEDSPFAKLRFHGCDFAVHSWDLAQALGATMELPSGWTDYMDGFFRSTPSEVLRRPRAFHDPEEPGDGDGPTSRLMAFLGRRPLSIEG